MQLLDSCQIAYALIDRCEPVKTARGRLTGHPELEQTLAKFPVADHSL